MHKKMIIIVSLVVVSLLIYSSVQAGYLFDYGELQGHPGAGEANWMAWYRTYPDGRPLEILTEDNTNCIDGEDVGYSDIFDIGEEIEDEDAYLEWILQAENFSSQPFGGADEIKLLFGGLGSHSGTLWKEIFLYDNTEPYTDHGLVPSLEGDYPACPTLYEPTASDPTTYSFYSTQPGIYLVYKSQNASGAENGASNGRYTYFTQVPTTTGYGTFTDTSTGPNWYIVFQFDPENDEPIGCHSEPADPTNVELGEFSVSYNSIKSAVEISWETINESNILGFNIYRSTSESGLKVMIHTEDAESPGQTDGYQYTFDDFNVEPCKTYFYWIEIDHLTGNDEMAGPKSVWIPGGDCGFFQYLPIFLNP